MSDFEWDKPKEKAAQLLADGELSDQEVAKKAGVARMTLYRWRQNPEFAARVKEHLSAFCEHVRRRGIAVRERRVDALNDRWLRMRSVIDQRAEDPKMARVPGGVTGLIVHNVKGVGKGEDFQLIDLYEVDTGLLRELREHEKQAAQELGQWVEKQETRNESSHTIVAALSDDLETAYSRPGDSEDTLDDADDLDPV